MRLGIKIFLICFVIVNWTRSTCIAQDLYDYKNSAAFADYLSATSQYSLAVAEYERLLFLNPTADTLQQKLLLAYRKSGNNTFGLKRAENLYPQPTQMPLGVARIYADMLLKEKAFSKADSFLLSSRNLPDDDRFLYLGTSQALNSNWSGAVKYYSQVNPGRKPIVSSYQQIAVRALVQPRKSPALAAGLSALLPGAGKVYTKDWKDGAIALFMVGTSAWQAQRAFKKSGSDSVRGWIFASVTTGFYIGNIFGSHKAAKSYNQRQNERNQKEIENIFYTDF